MTRFASPVTKALAKPLGLDAPRGALVRMVAGGQEVFITIPGKK
jgi:hypothetical protein